MQLANLEVASPNTTPQELTRGQGTVPTSLLVPTVEVVASERTLPTTIIVEGIAMSPCRGGSPVTNDVPHTAPENELNSLLKVW